MPWVYFAAEPSIRYRRQHAILFGIDTVDLPVIHQQKQVVLTVVQHGIAPGVELAPFLAAQRREIAETARSEAAMGVLARFFASMSRTLAPAVAASRGASETRSVTGYRADPAANTSCRARAMRTV